MGMNALVQMVLKEAGVDPDRFSLQWASAAEAPRFVKLITDFTQKTRELGPLGQAEGIEPAEMTARLEKALAAVNDRKVRMFFGNATKSLRKEGTPSQERISEVIGEKMTKPVTASLTSPAEEAPKKEKDAPAKAVEKKAAAAPKKKTAKGKKAPAKKKKA